MNQIETIRTVVFGAIGIGLGIEALLILTAKISLDSYLVAGTTIGSLAIILLLEAMRGFEKIKKWYLKQNWKKPII